MCSFSSYLLNDDPKGLLIVTVRFSFSNLVEAKEQVEQKHVHLLQILDAERQAKWFYVQQTEELAVEVKQLKAEVGAGRSFISSTST